MQVLAKVMVGHQRLGSPHSRALLVDLKHHPKQAYWFLHWFHSELLSIDQCKASALCQGISLEGVFLSEHPYYSMFLSKSQLQWHCKNVSARNPIQLSSSARAISPPSGVPDLLTG